MNTIKLSKEKSKDGMFYYEIDVYGIMSDISTTLKLEDEGEYLVSIIDSVDEILTNRWTEEGRFESSDCFHHLKINTIANLTSPVLDKIEIVLDSKYNLGHVIGRDGEYVLGLSVSNIIMSNIIKEYCKINEKDYWKMDDSQIYSGAGDGLESYMVTIDKEEYTNSFFEHYCSSIKDLIGSDNFYKRMNNETDIISFL